MPKANFKLEGMNELKKSIDALGKVPQKHVIASAKAGMVIVKRAAKKNAPVDKGNLKDGIILTGEKSALKGKKVFDIVFDRLMNDIFQKKNSDGEINAYYPVSQEYGYFTKNGRYIPGFKFVHNALAQNKTKVEKKMVSTMKTKVDKAISKAGLK